MGLGMEIHQPQNQAPEIGATLEEEPQTLEPKKKKKKKKKKLVEDFNDNFKQMMQEEIVKPEYNQDP